VGTIIQLTDRSRYETGLDRCERARMLNYHWGPSSYGITRKAQSIPLATGTLYHAGLAHVLQWVKSYEDFPDHDTREPLPDTVVRDACRIACEGYDRVVALRGLVDEGHRLEEVASEQKALIEGFIWAFCLSLLPWLREQYRVISVEHDDAKVLACTCGLGDLIGTLADHEARDCEGVGFQFRLDLVTEYRSRPGVLAYWEFKGTGQTGEMFESKWETAPQFALGAVMEQERLGHPIAEAWVIALIKGRREGDTYNPETKRREGDQRQQSPLCYGYYKPANPPMEQEDWQAEYETKDEWGKGHRLPKAYQKRGVWELGTSVELGEGVTASEAWCKSMPPELLAKQIMLIGPLQVNPVLVQGVVEELVAEEARWKQTLYELYDALEASGFDWTAEGYQAALRRLVPRSWSCRRYGKRHQCQFVPICFEHEGWGDPLANGFIVRRPHHAAELQQMEARGLTPPEGWAEDEEVD
jgi:hypothetical protein